MGSHPWAYPQWGLLSKAGIPKPSYRAFELLNKAGPLRFPVTISGQPAAGSVSVLATAEVNTAACNRLLTPISLGLYMAVLQYDDGADLQLFISNMVPIYLSRNCTAVDVDISVSVNSTSTMAVPHALVTVIDADHANPVEAWEARGSPMVLSREDTAGKW